MGTDLLPAGERDGMALELFETEQFGARDYRIAVTALRIPFAFKKPGYGTSLIFLVLIPPVRGYPFEYPVMTGFAELTLYACADRLRCVKKLHRSKDKLQHAK
jgi:hypothetical protein